MTRYKHTRKGRIPFTPAEELDFDSMILPQAKTDLIALEKEKRIDLSNAAINGFQVRSYEDRENIQGAIDYYDVLTSNGAVDLVWTMEDNTDRIVTKAELQAVKDEYVTRKAIIFSNYQGKKEEAKSAKDLNDIETVSNT